MKIEGIKEKLLLAISSAERAAGKNPTLPILSSIYLETSTNSLVIRATNLDLGIEFTVPVKVIEGGVAVIPSGVLGSLLSNLSEEKITLELVGETLALSTKSTSTVIRTLPADDFPIIPKEGAGKGVSLESEVFADALSSVLHSAAVTSMKPELGSIYVYGDGEEIVFAATDSFRLAEKRIPAKRAKGLGSALIPFRNVPEIIRFLSGSKGETLLSHEGNQISFTKDGAYLISRTIEGTFPDYKQIVPKTFKTEATLLKEDLLRALKLAHVLSDTFNQVTFHLVPGEKLFEITTKNINLGESHSTLSAALKGEDLALSFNYKYIMESFQSIISDSVFLAFQGAGKPLLIKGISDRTFFSIVMPMNK